MNRQIKIPFLIKRFLLIYSSGSLIIDDVLASCMAREGGATGSTGIQTHIAFYHKLEMGQSMMCSMGDSQDVCSLSTVEVVKPRLTLPLIATHSLFLQIILANSEL